MESQSQKQQIIVAVVMLLIGFLIGVLITAGWYQGDSDGVGENATSTDTQQVEDNGSTGDENVADDESDLADRSNSDGSGSVSSGEVSVLASDQVAGDEVQVATVTTTTTSWVAVRESSEAGMGNILGAKRVEAGTHTDVVVRLLRATEPGNQYFVTVYRD
ncbi:MAG: hypothetical protein WD049_04015, partial [Candidatus Paceibacterota bacterium]